MNEDELKKIVGDEIDNSLSYLDDQISIEQNTALKYYRGDLYGDERSGKSQVVTTEVRDSIEWAVPSLVRSFYNNVEGVVFDPVTPDDEAHAKQATDYANFVVNKQNNGFLIFTTWLKDGLLQKLGAVKSFWEETTNWSLPQTFEGLSEDEFILRTAGDEVDVLAHTERFLVQVYTDDNQLAWVPQDIAEETRLVPDVEPQAVHDIEIRVKETTGKIKIDVVPPEELIVSRDAKFNMETGGVDAALVGHRRKVTCSELVELGFDKNLVDELPDANPVHTATKSERWIKQTPSRDNRGDVDRSRREVDVYEIYINVDWDGDGVAELRKITFGGDGADGVLLDNEEWDWNPFSVFTPIILPHVLHGLSLADLVMTYQRVKSTLWRQMLDNIYRTNSPQKLVDVGKVDVQAVARDEIGGMIPTENMDAVRDLTTPFTAGASIPLIQIVDNMIESQVGVGKSTNGVNPEILQNTTATQANIANTAVQAKIEMMARTFGETGLKHLYKTILHLASKHAPRDTVVRLRNDWVPMDPTAWNPRMDVTINVGLGVGSREQQTAHLNNIAQKQEQILLALGPDNPLVNYENYHNTLTQLTNNAGLRNTHRYFTDPSEFVPPEQDQNLSPEEKKLQAEIQLKREKNAADIQLQREKMQNEMALKREELAAEYELKKLDVMNNDDARPNLRSPI